MRVHREIRDAWPAYFLLTERIVSWTELHTTLTIADVEKIYHAEMAKRALEARARQKNRPTSTRTRTVPDDEPDEPDEEPL